MLKLIKTMKFHFKFNRVLLCLFSICISSSLFSQYVPTLLYPHNNETTTSTTIKFTWNKDFYNNAQYEFQLSTDTNFTTLLYSINTNYNWYTPPALVGVGQKHFWRVRSIFNTVTSPWSTTRSFLLFNPNSINGLTLWIDPSLDVSLAGANVQSVNDQSGNLNNAFQNNNTQRPLFVASDSLMNNKPIFRFDGTDDFLEILDNFSIDYTDQFSMHVLVKPTIISVNKTIMAKWDYQTQGSWAFQTDFATSNQLMFAPALSINDAGNQKALTTNANMTLLKPSLLTLVYNGNFVPKVKFFKNFNLLISTTENIIPSVLPNSTATLKIGKYGGVATRYYQGDIGEILIFNNELSLPNKSLVDSYLRYRYAPPVSLGKDTIMPSNSLCTIFQLKAQSKYSTYLWSNGTTASKLIINKPGIYWLTATDFLGNVTVDSIIIYPPYKDNFPQSSGILCAGNNIQWQTSYPPANYTFLWQNGATTNNFNITQSGSYYLKITDAAGCFIRTDTLVVTVDLYPFSANLGPDTTLCTSNIIALQSGALQTTTYLWQDGSSNPTLSVQFSGVYSVQTTNINNCVAQDTINVIVAGVGANLSYSSPPFACQNTAINLTENSTITLPNQILSRTWTFSNGQNFSSSTISVLPSNTGWLSGNISIVSTGNCITQDTFSIFIHPRPILTMSNIDDCSNDNILFQANNIGNAALNNYQWNFGQASSGALNTSILASPIHFFGAAGTYNIELIASDVYGCLDTIIDPLLIFPAPISQFSFNNTCESNNVLFNNTSSVSDTSTIILNSWDYGDNTQAINPSFAKQYPNYGQYNVQLVVQSSNGCSDTSIQAITIHPNPILDWIVGPSCKNSWTTFTDSSTIPLGTISGTNWEVNLQYNYPFSNYSYQFLTSGIQYLTLSVTSDQGCISDSLLFVDVQPELIASYSVNPSIISAEIPITFINQSNGSTSCSWTLSDGATSTLDTLIHSFDNSLIDQTIELTMVVGNSIGCFDTIISQLQINPYNFDIALTNLFVEDINGFIQLGVEMTNVGAITMNQCNLWLKMLNSTLIQEQWLGELLPGESEIYIFTASPTSFITLQDNSYQYICVEAQASNVFNIEDEDLSNNSICTNLENSGVIFLPISPNPATNNITLTFYVPKDQGVIITMYDAEGRLIYSFPTNEFLEAGMYTIDVNTSQYAAGSYIIRMQDEITTQTKHWIKN